MSTGWIVLGVIVILVLFAFAAYNRLVALSQRVGQAFADIDVQLKQRHDLIPNLVETVKGYASHERGTLDDVIKARNSAMSAQGPATGRGRRKPAERRARPADRAVGGLSRPQGQRQLPAAVERTVRPREQDRGRPPLLQQRGPGIQHRHPADARRAVRRHVRLHQKGILRSRRQQDRGRGGADGVQVLDPACAKRHPLAIGSSHDHGRLRSLHAHRIEQVAFDAAARRAVPADLRAGLCRRAAGGSR